MQSKKIQLEESTSEHIPIQLDCLDQVLNEEALFAMAKGMFMIRDPQHQPYQHAITNFTLFPVKMPISLFQRMNWFNDKLSQLLMKVMVETPEWIIEIASLIQDPFIQKLVSIARQYLKNPKQSFTCTILRNDFMIDNKANPSIELIEFNTISCGLSILGRKVSALHQHANQCFPSLFPKDNPGLISSVGEIAPGDALYYAFQEYGKQDACVLLIGQQNEKNEGDRYGVRLDLFERHHILAHVVTLAQVDTDVSQESGALFYKGKQVALVYYRAGYCIEEYGEKQWKAREKLELSKAVKCPNILLHLLTLKRFQTEFGLPDVLARFEDPNDPEFEPFRSVFQSFVMLRKLTPRAIDMIKEAQTHPEQFVIKTSKQAGQGNIFDPDQIATILSAYPEHPQQLESYLLMPRIALPSRIIPVCVDGKLISQSMNDEFSQFMYIGSNITTKEIKPQKSITRLVRTKKTTETQGSFFRGACLSSIWCYEDEDPSHLDKRFFTGHWEDVVN